MSDYKKNYGNKNHQRPIPDKEVYKQKYVTVENILKFEDLKEDLSDMIDEISLYVKLKLRKDVITPTQIRNIYNRIVKIDGNVTKLQLLRPKLAFIAGKFGNDKYKREVIDFFITIIKEVKEPSQVKHFKTFMEAVVAYHKYHHGDKDKYSMFQFLKF